MSQHLSWAVTLGRLCSWIEGHVSLSSSVSGISSSQALAVVLSPYPFGLKVTAAWGAVRCRPCMVSPPLCSFPSVSPLFPGGTQTDSHPNPWQPRGALCTPKRLLTCHCSVWGDGAHPRPHPAPPTQPSSPKGGESHREPIAERSEWRNQRASLVTVRGNDVCGLCRLIDWGSSSASSCYRAALGCTVSSLGT